MTMTKTEPTVTTIAFHGPPRPKYFIKIRSKLPELLHWQPVNDRQAYEGKNITSLEEVTSFSAPLAR